MLLPEADARKLWCPFTTRNSKCLASSCMAWSWDKPSSDFTPLPSDAPPPEPPKGSCGLAERV